MVDKLIKKIIAKSGYFYLDFFFQYRSTFALIMITNFTLHIIMQWNVGSL